MHDRPIQPPDQITDGADTPTGQVWSEEIKGTLIPDLGLTQHYDVLRELGDCHTAVGDYEDARDCYDRAAVLAPDEAGPYVGLGVIALQQNKLDDAETAFRVACRLDPRCSKGYCGLALVRQQRGLWDEAFDLYLKSLELNSDDLTALLGLFQASCQRGSFGQVIHYLRRYLDVHPGDTSVMFCLATLELKDGRRDRARELLLSILTLDPANRDAANLLEEVEHALIQPVC